MAARSLVVRSAKKKKKKGVGYLDYFLYMYSTENFPLWRWGAQERMGIIDRWWEMAAKKRKKVRS